MTPVVTVVDVQGAVPSILTCDLLVQLGAVQSVQLLTLTEIYRDLDVFLPGLPGRKGDPGMDGKDGVDGKDGKDGIASIQEVPYQFSVAATSWLIQHDLGRRPNVRVLTGDGTRIYPGIRDIDANNVEIGFNWPMSGVAFIS